MNEGLVIVSSQKEGISGRPHTRFIEKLHKIVLLFGILWLSACTASKPAAAQAVATYLQTLVEKDDTRLVTLVCPDYEMEALLEFDAFGLVETSLENLACEQQAIVGDRATVVCQGSIQATYGNELRSFDLSQRTYTVIHSGEDWLVCGYTK